MIVFATLARPAPKPIASSLARRAAAFAACDVPPDSDTIHFVVRSRPDRRGRQDFDIVAVDLDGRPSRVRVTGDLDEYRTVARNAGMAAVEINPFADEAGRA